jgi:hypothetical protein
MSAPEISSSNGTPPTTAELRAEIAKTRADLGETVTALAAKTDVKARTKDAVAETTDHVKQVASDTVDQVKHTAAEQARTIGPWALLGAAAGAVVGLIWVRRRTV